MSTPDLPSEQACGPPPRLHADAGLRALLQRRLQAFEPRAAVAAPGLQTKHAAVMLVVTEAGHGADLSGLPSHARWCRDAALLLTRRSSALRRHAGQWALPGGLLDAGEAPEQAALRELREETGLCLPPSALLGRLDDYSTRSGYLITPLVAWAGAASTLQANPAEVDSIHRIPVAELLRADAPMLEPGTLGAHPVLRMPVGDSWIAAPTAALLYQFREVCMLDRPTRVAHFDQPVFAWT